LIFQGFISRFSPPPRGDGRGTAIVVLGAAVGEDGRPSPALARRIAEGRRLWAAGRGEAVIGSGGLGRWPPSEARAIRDALVAAGVPADAALMEDRSRSTFENARFSIALMRRRGLGRALVVSDGYHLPRAVMTFQLLGMPAQGAAPPGRGGGRGWTRLRLRLREVPALPLYLGRGLLWRLARRDE
jgi:uncharacterized SAM-binding protein YcdF (DUF218 family)